MRLTDGKRTVEITMQEWAGNEYTPDWSADFFEAGGLPRNETGTARVVQNVGYCIEQANDWAAYRGDFCDLAAMEADKVHGRERCVNIMDVEE